MGKPHPRDLHDENLNDVRVRHKKPQMDSSAKVTILAYKKERVIGFKKKHVGWRDVAAPVARRGKIHLVLSMSNVRNCLGDYHIL